MADEKKENKENKESSESKLLKMIEESKDKEEGKKEESKEQPKEEKPSEEKPKEEQPKEEQPKGEQATEQAKDGKEAEPTAQSAGSKSETPKGQDVAKQLSQAVRGKKVTKFSLVHSIEALVPGAAALGLSKMSIGMKEVNNFLMGGVSVLTVLLLFQFYTGTKLLNSRIEFASGSTVSRSSGKFVPEFLPVSEYLAKVDMRNIFRPVEKKEGAEEVSPEEPRQIAEKTQNFKLVGISWLDTVDSASAMIEDQNTGMTYFLKKGDTLQDVVLKTIYADRIILTYQGEEITIKL